MPKRRELISGQFAHRRTETDYMSTLLDTVKLDDWREIIESTVAAAKEGDTSARNWLAQYLVGKAGTTAPAPLTVIAHQLSGHDHLVEMLARQHVDQELYPALGSSHKLFEAVKAQLEDELQALETAPQGESGSTADHDDAKS
jgi:hypothetical protein